MFLFQVSLLSTHCCLGIQCVKCEAGRVPWVFPSLALTECDSSHSTDEMKELEVRGDLCDNDLSCSFSANFKHHHAMINITIENWIKGNIDGPSLACWEERGGC